MKLAPAVAAVLLSAVGLGACGGDGGTQIANTLADRVATIREAAEDGDAKAARAELDKLEHDVRAARESGALDDVRAGAILAAAKLVDDDLGLLDGQPVTTRRTTTTTTTVPTTVPDTRDDKEHDDDDKGRGKGGGKGKDDDD